MGQGDRRIASFFGRVRFERDVLRAINTLPIVHSHLDGLSPQTRISWISKEPSISSYAELVLLLDEAWSLLGQLADHSRMVFEDVTSGDAEVAEFFARLSAFSANLRIGAGNRGTDHVAS